MAQIGENVLLTYVHGRDDLFDVQMYPYSSIQFYISSFKHLKSLEDECSRHAKCLLRLVMSFHQSLWKYSKGIFIVAFYFV